MKEGSKEKSNKGKKEGNKDSSPDSCLQVKRAIGVGEGRGCIWTTVGRASEGAAVSSHVHFHVRCDVPWVIFHHFIRA